MSIGDLNAKISRSRNVDFETLQCVSLYAHDENETAQKKLKSLQLDANGNLKVSSSPISGGATEAKQDDIIFELQNQQTTLNEIDTSTTIIKGITQSSFGGVSQIATSNGLSLRGCYGIDGANFNVMKVTSSGELSTTNSKISKGEDASIPSGSGGLQQILCYGQDNQGDLEPLNIDNSGHLKITINDVDETNTGLKIAGETQLGAQVNIKVGATGNLRTHETLERLNTTESLTILTTDTNGKTTTPIDMSDYTTVAVFGDTNNTTNLNMYFEYSANNVDWFRGADASSTIIVVAGNGNFYASEKVISKWVRVRRFNSSGATENISFNFTRA